MCLGRTTDRLMTLIPSSLSHRLPTPHGLSRRLLILLALALAPLPLRAQEEVPEAARTLLEEAQQAQNAGRDDDAIKKYGEVIELAPNTASAYVGLGAIY